MLANAAHCSISHFWFPGDWVSLICAARLQRIGMSRGPAGMLLRLRVNSTVVRICFRVQSGQTVTSLWSCSPNGQHQSLWFLNQCPAGAFEDAQCMLDTLYLHIWHDGIDRAKVCRVLLARVKAATSPGNPSNHACAWLHEQHDK